MLEVDMVHNNPGWIVFEGGELVKVVWSIGAAQDIAYNLKPTKINYHTSREVYDARQTSGTRGQRIVRDGLFFYPNSSGHIYCCGWGMLMKNEPALDDLRPMGAFFPSIDDEIMANGQTMRIISVHYEGREVVELLCGTLDGENEYIVYPYELTEWSKK